MADKLKFSLVSPERELFSGEVDQVNIPGSEGDLGILPNHSPLMAAIRTGTITVTANGHNTVFFIAGGFADVTPDGLTVLAEQAMPLESVTKDSLSSNITAVKASLETLQGDAALTAQQNLDGLNALLASL